MLFLVFRQKYYVTGARDYQSRSNALMLIKWETLRTVEPRFPAVVLGVVIVHLEFPVLFGRVMRLLVGR